MPESTQKVKFKRGQSETMPSDLEAGSLLVQVDTGDIFLDNTQSDRIQLGDSRKLSLSGGTMTGNITMGSHKVTGLGTPSADSDAATKAYVDDAVANASSPSAANQFLTATAAATATKTITGTRPSSGSVFFVLFQNGVTASSGTFTFSFSVGGTCSVSGGSGFPTMPTIAIPAWTMGTFYMNSASTAKFIAYTNYIDDGVVS